MIVALTVEGHEEHEFHSQVLISFSFVQTFLYVPRSIRFAKTALVTCGVHVRHQKDAEYYSELDMFLRESWSI